VVEKWGLGRTAMSNTSGRQLARNGVWLRRRHANRHESGDRGVLDDAVIAERPCACRPSIAGRSQAYKRSGGGLKGLNSHQGRRPCAARNAIMPSARKSRMQDHRVTYHHKRSSGIASAGSPKRRSTKETTSSITRNSDPAWDSPIAADAVPAK
jgi:hypothetical protein